VSAEVGASFTYRVEVSNGGDVTATGATATIAIPNGLQLQSSSVTQGTCSNSVSQVSCNLDNVPAAATRTITLTLRGASAGRFTSDIQVAAANDANKGNDTAQAIINIGAVVGGTTVFESHFDTGSGGFFYLDNTFRATRQATYASGTWLPTGGFSGAGLRVALGGLNDNDVLNMSGGWRHPFRLNAQRRLTLSLRVKLDQAANYGNDAISQALLSLDGRLIGATASQDFLTQLRGNGVGGAPQSTGWQQLTIDLGVLEAGAHNITLGAFNNKKTSRDERTDVFIDDVVLKGQ
jgi:uncharacterized repeat protein (TIGR01451 family)